MRAWLFLVWLSVTAVAPGQVIPGRGETKKEALSDALCKYLDARVDLAIYGELRDLHALKEEMRVNPRGYVIDAGQVKSNGRNYCGDVKLDIGKILREFFVNSGAIRRIFRQDIAIVGREGPADYSRELCRFLRNCGFLVKSDAQLSSFWDIEHDHRHLNQWMSEHRVYIVLAVRTQNEITAWNFAGRPLVDIDPEKHPQRWQWLVVDEFVKQIFKWRTGKEYFFTFCGFPDVESLQSDLRRILGLSDDRTWIPLEHNILQIDILQGSPSMVHRVDDYLERNYPRAYRKNTQIVNVVEYSYQSRLPEWLWWGLALLLGAAALWYLYPRKPIPPTRPPQQSPTPSPKSSTRPTSQPKPQSPGAQPQCNVQAEPVAPPPVSLSPDEIRHQLLPNFPKQNCKVCQGARHNFRLLSSSDWQNEKALYVWCEQKIYCMHCVRQNQQQMGDYQLWQKIEQDTFGPFYIANKGDELLVLRMVPFTHPKVEDQEKWSKMLAKVRRSLKNDFASLQFALPVVGIEKFADGMFYATPYLPGWTLDQVLQQHSTLSWQQGFPLLYHIAAGCRENHQRKLIHRGITPSNAFCVADGRTLLRGFDMARHELEEFVFSTWCTHRIPSTEEKAMTLTGNTVGTPYYMAPEQILSAKDNTTRVDIWALGVIAYQMFTGRFITGSRFDKKPRAMEYMQTIINFVKNKQFAVDEIAAEIPDGAKKLIRRMLAVSPEERPDADQVMQELARCR